MFDKVNIGVFGYLLESEHMVLFQKFKKTRSGQSGELTGSLLATARNQHQLFQILTLHIVSKIVYLGKALGVEIFKTLA